jgi:hypothetical protein
MKVAFYTSHFGLREYDDAIYSYATGNESILGNKSVIVVPNGGIHNSQMEEKFRKAFDVFVFSGGMTGLDKVLIDQDCEVLYVIKAGWNDGVFSSKIKTSIHFTACFEEKEMHGDVFSALPLICTRLPTVNTLRSQLNIPDDATVFGRYGDIDCFDVVAAHEAIQLVLDNNPNIFFVFMNTRQYFDHPNVKYVDNSFSASVKAAVVSSCDAMLHATLKGESFGLAIAEFTSLGKTIITWKPDGYHRYSGRQYHHTLLKENALYYSNTDELYQILTNFTPILPADYCAVFTPEMIMKGWNERFLTNTVEEPTVTSKDNPLPVIVEDVVSPVVV